MQGCVAGKEINISSFDESVNRGDALTRSAMSNMNPEALSVKVEIKISLCFKSVVLILE
jgi:hypothetical protein